MSATSPARAGLAGLLAAALLGGCYKVPSPPPTGVSSFEVLVTHVTKAGTQTPVDVVKACVDRHGGIQGNVPEAERGTLACPYVISNTAVDFEVFVTARTAQRDEAGTLKQATDFNSPVALRSVPGDLALSYPYRWLQITEGSGHGVMRSSHLYAEMRVWAEDAPVELLYDGGTVIAGAPAEPEPPAKRSYATGSSRVIYFADPTLQSLQNVAGTTFSTLNSPLEQQFVKVGRAGVMDAGIGTPQDTLRQNCPGDPAHDGKPVQMVVTGLDCCGFFATDITACALPEDNSDANAQFRVAEPNGYYPGRFASLYVYNYSHPDDLNEGDLLWSIAGSVQEFTG
ncbi:MAG TPA: hypothetical protein VIG99_16155, partial [Myxococcaceae bacterium]